MPDRSDCVQKLAYATVEDGKLKCREGLEYDGTKKACVPENGKTWAEVATVCAGMGLIVRLDGTGCTARCGALETEVDHVCQCVQYAQRVTGAAKCACPTENFVEQSGKCACRSGTLLNPDKTDCVAELRYAVASGDAFACMEGLAFINGKCRPGPGKTWADFAELCSDAGGIVGLMGKTCENSCPPGQHGIAGRCACDAGMVQNGDRCECPTDNFCSNFKSESAHTCRQPGARRGGPYY